MILLDLFANLSDYSGKPINFSESIVDSLFYLEFEDSGLELKNIIETVYTDGIDGFEDVENDGTKITGVFIDKVSSGLTKRFRFTVTEDNISYKLLNPEDLDNLDDADFAELEFATTPTGKKKKCVKGQACGNTCITKNAECNAKPPREVKNSVKNILAKAAKPPKVAKGSVKQVQEKAARPPKVAKGSVKQVQEKAAKPPKEPKTTKAKKETEKEAEATKTKQSNLDRIEQIKKTAQAIKESQEKEVAKKTTTKQETPKTQAKVEETKTQAKKYPLDDEKDFEDAILNKFAELSNKYNGLVPIYQLRRELGETVPRDKFNNYMLNMQKNDLLQFKGGSVEDSARDKIADSLHTELDGIRAYAALGDGLTKESLNKRVSDTKDKVNTALKDKRPLSELGSAAALANAPKIKNQREFDDAIEEASNRLNNEFIMGGIVPLEKLRKSLGDRVSKEDFDNMMFEYIDRKDLNLGSNQRATESEIKNGIKDTFSGEVKDYLRIGSENKSKELVESKYPKSPEERFGSVEPQKKSQPESKKEAKTEPKKETKPEPKKELSNDVNEDTFSQLGHTGLEREINYGIYKKATGGKYGEYSDLLKEAALQRSDSRDYARGWMDRAPEIVRIANKEKIGSEDATELMDYADEQGMFRTGTPAGKVAAYAMLNSYAKADESGKKVIRERLQKMSDLKLVPDNQIGKIDPEHNDLIDELRRIQQDKKAEPQKEAKKETGKEVETTKTKENPQTQSKKALSELDFYEQGNVDTLGTGGLGSAYLDKNTRPPTVRKYGYIPEGEVELLEKMGKLGISPKVISKFEEADIDIEADTKYGKPGTYSMEFVEGATLYSKYTANKREIPEDVLENAIRSRRIMHEAGLAHGDMHSANIIEGSNGKLAIIDPIYYEGRSSGYENAYKDLFNSSFVDQVYSKSDNSSFADNWNEELDKFKQNQKNDLEKGKPSEEVYKKRISDFYKKLLGE